MNTDTPTTDAGHETGSEAGQDVTVTPVVAGAREPVHADPSQVQQLDPRELVMDANVRHDTRTDRAFVAAIRDLGVLQPIVAVLTDDGRARVRMGHRRTLAAIAGELDTVPVIVHPSVDTADAAEAAEEEADRLATQLVENTQREGLSNAEQLDVFVGLAALNLSAGQIAQRTKVKRRDVAAGLKAARTPEVRDAIATGLTLEQGAVLDEFTDAPEAYELLLDKALNGGNGWQSFDHLAQRLRVDRDERAAIERVTAELTAAGIPIVEMTYRRDDPTTRLADLTDAPDTEPEPGTDDGEQPEDGDAEDLDGDLDDDLDGDLDDDLGEDEEEPEDPWEPKGLPPAITREEHAACPGHAAQIGGYSRTSQPIWVCVDPVRYGHRSRVGRELRAAKAEVAQAGESSEEAEAREERVRAEAAKARREVIAGNKAWDAAETVRRDYMAELLTRRTPPKGSAAFVATVLATSPYAVSRAAEKGHELAAELLIHTPAALGERGSDRITKALAGASEARANVITLAIALGAVESSLSRDIWRQERRIGGPDASLVRQLGFLGACGYPLAPIERWATGEDIDPDEVFAPLTGRPAAATETGTAEPEGDIEPDADEDHAEDQGE